MLPRGLMLLLPGLLLLPTRRGSTLSPHFLRRRNRTGVLPLLVSWSEEEEGGFRESGDKRPPPPTGDVALVVLFALGVVFGLFLAPGSSVLAWRSLKMLGRVQAGDTDTRIGLMQGDGITTAADDGAGHPLAIVPSGRDGGRRENRPTVREGGDGVCREDDSHGGGGIERQGGTCQTLDDGDQWRRG